MPDTKKQPDSPPKRKRNTKRVSRNARPEIKAQFKRSSAKKSPTKRERERERMDALRSDYAYYYEDYFNVEIAQLKEDALAHIIAKESWRAFSPYEPASVRHAARKEWYRQQDNTVRERFADSITEDTFVTKRSNSAVFVEFVHACYQARPDDKSYRRFIADLMRKVLRDQKRNAIRAMVAAAKFSAMIDEFCGTSKPLHRHAAAYAPEVLVARYENA